MNPLIISRLESPEKGFFEKAAEACYSVKVCPKNIALAEN